MNMIFLKQYKFIFLIFLIGSTSFGFAPQSAVWQKSLAGIYESDVRALTVDPHNSLRIYAATSRAIYVSEDGGKNYRMIFQLPGEESEVNSLYLSVEVSSQSNSLSSSNSLYVATNAGLYQSLEPTKNFSKIFQSSDEDSRVCLSVIEHNGMIFLGTQKGLFLKGTHEQSWHKMQEALNNEAVYFSAQDEDFLYFATDRRLFRLNKKNRKIEKIFSVGARDVENEENEYSEDSSSSSVNRWIKDMRVAEDSGMVILAASKGLYASFNHGDDWQRFESGSVPLEDVTSLEILEILGSDLRSDPNIFVGTEKGAYFSNDIKGGQWTSVYKGMETNTIRDLAQDALGGIYAATDQGIFFLSFEKALPSEVKTQPACRQAGDTGTQEEENRQERLRNYTDTQGHFSYEPNIRQVHGFAIEYSEVSPDKITDWRRAVKRSAWLPSLSIGADGDKNLGYDDSVSTTTSSGGSSYTGPDDKSWDDNLGWDVSLSWDFSELIWNSDQTSIDSRSKLMVELREDLLDQITRLYFERRRLQTELLTLASLDPQLSLDKKMRIEELTALIDAMTGGQFSRAIEENLRRQEKLGSDLRSDPN